MLKLYRFTDDEDVYWETWQDEDGVHIVHAGTLGTEGETRELAEPDAAEQVQDEMNALLDEGFHTLEPEDHYTLVIEYAVDGMGTEADLDKRSRLQERMDQTLGWTGLGECDGGSIGGGTMEVCNYVVDFDLAREVIEHDLAGTEFDDYTRIYDEDEEYGDEDEADEDEADED